jgi:RNA polymerase sigma-70 factor (ECF subfamily)
MAGVFLLGLLSRGEKSGVDVDAVQRARNGDEDAYTFIVDQHREAVFRLAYLLLGDADDAEDIAQETFWRAFRHLHQYDPEYALRPWLLRITTNLARNRQRSLGRYLGALQRFARLVPPLVPPTPEMQSAQTAEANALWQAVRCLNHPEQEIIYLRCFLEMPVSETAEVLNVQPGTVKSRLHRALGRLRQVIEQDFPQLVEINHE